MRLHRISWRLFAIFLVVSPLPMAAITWLFLDRFEHAVTETTLANLASIADKKVDQIATHMSQRLVDARNLARLARTQAALAELAVAHGAAAGVSNLELYDDLYAGYATNGGYYDLLLVDTDGNVVFSVAHEADAGTNLITGPYRDTQLAHGHRAASELLDTVITDFRPYAPSGDRPSAFVVAPVLHDGRLLGTLALQLDLAQLARVTSDNTGLGGTGETVLAQRVGDEVLYAAALRHIPDAAFRYRVKFADAARPMQAALRGEHGEGITRDYHGVDIVGAWRYLPDLRWGMVVKMDASEALAPLHRLRLAGFGALLAIVLGAAAAALLFGRTLVRPLRELTAASERISEGDLSHRVAVSGWEESEQLGRTFNRMVERLLDARTHLERRVEERTAELSASELRFRQLFQNMSSGGVIYQAIDAGDEFVFKDINAAVERIEGVRREELVGRRLTEAFPGVKEMGLFAVLQRVWRTGEPEAFPLSFYGDGRIQGWRENFVYRLSTGELVVIYEDVTDRKRSEEALRTSEERLQRVLKGSNDAWWDWDLVADTLDYSPRWWQMLGYVPNELPSDTALWARLMHPDDAQHVDAVFGTCLREGGASYELEFRLLHKQGHYVPVLSRGFISRDEAGRPLRVSGTNTDITERKRAEASLRQSEQRLRNLSDNLPRGATYQLLRTAAGETRFAYASAGMERLFQAPLADILADASRFYRCIDASDRVRLEAAEAESARTLTPFDLTFRVETGDRSRRYVHCRSMPQRLPDGALLWDGILLDVTSEKEAEAELIRAREVAEAANRAKSEFLANMSHEIRTPMNAIIGLTQLTLDTELSARQKDYLGKVLASSRALLGILNDILDYSKIEARRLTIESIPMRVEESLKEVADLFGARIEEKGLELFLDIAPEVPPVVLGDPLRLRQVLNNLVGNATKFTEEGEIHVRVDLAERAGERLTLRIAVRDTGIGLDHGQAARLFQPFTQADGSITRKYGGTGLGLAISSRLVGLMGGEMSVSSTQGQGATFSFTLQVGAAHGDGRDQDLQRLRGLRTLVVDDQETSRGILEQLLGAWQMEVECRAGGEQVVDALCAAERSGRPFDAALVDWRMPQVDGLAVARQIQQAVEEGRLRRPPLAIMVTAYDRDELMGAAGQTRLDAVLEKPVTPSALFDTLLRLRYPGGGGGGDRPGGPVRAVEHSLRGARVLVVEDQPLNQQVAAEFLRRIGLSVAVAGDGRIALERAVEERFDAILMDLHMPVMDGFEATALIRERCGAAAPPVIAMTAAVLPEDRARCERVGMVDFVAKPIDPDELTRVLERWIGGREGPRPSGAAESAAPAAEAWLPAELPGFDLAGARARVGGNEQLLARLLRQLAHEHADFGVRLGALLEGGDTAGAAQLVHALKGTAGNLGATALAGAAGLLEAQLRSGAAVAAGAELEQRLREACDAIAALPLPVPAATDAPVAPVPAELLDELAHYLEERELIPQSLIGRLSQLAAAAPTGHPLPRLLAQIERIDYAGGLITLHELAAQLGIAPAGGA